MVIDLRRYTRRDLLSRIAVASLNCYEEGGIKPVRVLRSARHVGGDQFNVIGGVNLAREVGGNQGNGIGIGVNYAREVGGEQFNVIGGVNLAREVGGDQFNVIGGVNLAREVGGDQFGGILCVQTENPRARQARCLVRYNPAEGFGFGSSVFTKIERARKYLATMEEKLTQPDYQGLLKSLIREKPTLRRRLTGHWTYADALSKEARRRLQRK